MNYEGHHGNSRFMQSLYVVGMVLTIMIAFLQLKDRLLNPPPPVEATPAGAGTGFGSQLSSSQSGSQPSSDQPRPSATRAGSQAVDLDSLTFVATAPTLGQTVKNPVRFSWQPATGVYYAVKIHHTEPDKSYDTTSQWTQGGAVELNLPDAAIGNLEWCLLAATEPGGEIKGSPWYHFTFDPFYQNKDRQDGAGE